MLERARSRLEDGSRRVEADRGRASLAGVSDGAIGWSPLGDEAMQAIEDLGRLLIGHEPEGELGGGVCRDDGLGAWAGIAAEDAVDLRRGPRPELLDHAHALFAGRGRQSDRAKKGGDVEVERAPLRELAEARGDHPLVEARQGHPPACVMHIGKKIGEHADGIARRSP